MSSNRVEEIKKEDKKAFKGFAIMMVISAMIGAVIGGGFKYLQENLGDNLSEFLVNRLMMITPYASLVLSILVIIVSVVCMFLNINRYICTSKTSSCDFLIYNKRLYTHNEKIN